MSDTVNVKGLSDLQKFLDQLPAKIERNVMRGALRAGAKVIVPAAKQGIRSISGELADSIKSGSTARGGKVTGYVRTRFYRAKWVEYGTRPHFISVRPEDRPNRMTRRGLRPYSIRTINRMVERGSLVIGKNFVGGSVSHGGARPKPFLRPALDTMASEAVVAVGEYVKQRLATKHGLDTSDVNIEAED